MQSETNTAARIRCVFTDNNGNTNEEHLCRRPCVFAKANGVRLSSHN